MRFGMLVLGLTTLALAAQPLEAQGRRNDDARRDRGPDKVPPGHLPAPGECRVWVDGVPPGRQAAPTDCASARRDAQRSGGRVIYGSDAERRGDVRRDDDDRRDDRDDDRSDAGDWCLDRDRDGVCDSAERDGRADGPIWRVPAPRDDACVDRDRDGRCDADDDRRWGSMTLPDGRPRMSAALEFDRGVRSSEVVRWVGPQVHEVKITRVFGRPLAATFYDRDERILQRWKKEDDQGRMREIELYENGRLVRTISR